ncbi:MAG TPA: radical SAM protein [Thermoanaerobaculia bacterium]|nr:radical SAM protein [Thermoanaerobaculia bacterium]
MFADRPGAVWMGLLETNRGCPFQCTFCDWGSAVASAVRNFDEARVRAEIEWLARHGVEYVFCCDANFGILPRDISIAEHVADVHRATGRPVTFATQATKNATERSYRVQKTLAESGVQGAVTVSLQSLDLHALELVKRANISITSFMELQRRYVRDGIPTYTDMILGLPGETYESWVGGLSTLVASGQHDRVSFYNCAVLPNAEMGDPAYQKAHGMRLVSQRIIEAHAGLAEVERQPVAEYLDVVVETAALPAADWRRARVFAGLLELCYYDRLMQIPWALAGALWQVDVRSLVEALLDADRDAYPILTGVRERFERHARAVQEGASDLLPSPEHLGIYWPLDQLTLIEMVADWRLDAFYGELAQIGAATCAASNGFDPELWREAVTVNRALLRLPFQVLNGIHQSSWDLVGMWRGHTAGEVIAPSPGPCRYRIQRSRPPLHSLDAWCEFLVLCQNNKPGYLYTVEVEVEVEEGTLEPAVATAGPAASGHPGAGRAGGGRPHASRRAGIGSGRFSPSSPTAEPTTRLPKPSTSPPKR